MKDLQTRRNFLLMILSGINRTDMKTVFVLWRVVALTFDSTETLANVKNVTRVMLLFYNFYCCLLMKESKPCNC